MQAQIDTLIGKIKTDYIKFAGHVVVLSSLRVTFTTLLRSLMILLK